MTRWQDIEPGFHGIQAVDPQTPGAMICGSCGRAWMRDITPAGRCPWAHDHAHSDGFASLPDVAFERTGLDPDLSGLLDWHEVQVNGEGEPSLVHKPCKRVLCSIDPGDTLAVLAAIAVDHSERCER